MDAFDVSSSATTIRLKKMAPQAAPTSGRQRSSSQPSSSQPSTPHRHHSGERAPLAPSEVSRAFEVTRVHRGGSTRRFYEEVVSPCVNSCLAGQSFIFLLNGPVESGRSQTMYGSPHHSEMGVVELAAEELLLRAAERATAAAAASSSSAGAAATGSSATPPPPASSSAFTGITITYSAFLLRGSSVVNTVSGTPVEWVPFPAPIGLFPLAQMRLLEHARESVVLPERKHSDTSCVIQFQVYTPVDTIGTRAAATLTFIDMAAIKLPLCQEVDRVYQAVMQCATKGAAMDTSSSELASSALLTLLKPALVDRSTSLVSITTISGRPDLYEPACVAMQLAANIRLLPQVLLLTHLRPPRWVFEASAQLEQHHDTGGREREAAYSRGVADLHATISKWLMKDLLGGGDGSGGMPLQERTAQHLALETESIREHIQSDGNRYLRGIVMRTEEMQRAAGEQDRLLAAIQEQQTQCMESLQHGDLRRRQMTEQLHTQEVTTAKRISEIQLAISSTDASRGVARQQQQQHMKAAESYVAQGAALQSAIHTHTRGLHEAIGHRRAVRQLSGLKRQREGLEKELAEMSRQASRRNHELKEVHLKQLAISEAERRVEALRREVATL